jgi:hypothetical protein
MVVIFITTITAYAMEDVMNIRYVYFLYIKDSPLWEVTLKITLHLILEEIMMENELCKF